MSVMPEMEDGGGDRYEGMGAEELAALNDVDDAPDVLRWVPPGPVSQRFYLDDTARIVALMGPVGGGKTSTVIMKRLRMASLMPPDADGWRRDLVVVIRNTYRSAAKSTMVTWQEWLPKTFPGSTWTGGDDRPITHVIRGRLQDGTRFEATTEVIGLNGNHIEAVMRGKAFSSAWINEAADLPREVLPYVQQRLGRFPRKDALQGREPFRQLLMDLNAPDNDHWLRDVLVDNRPPGLAFYQQPPGLLRLGDGAARRYAPNPAAENVSRLPAGYYDEMAAREEDWYIRRFVMNEWGYSRDGLPVYADYFDERVHVAKSPLTPDRSRPVLAGVDGSTAGLRPAAVLFQLMGDGGIRIYSEVIPGQGYGAARFGELMQAALAERFIGCPALHVWADPASQYGADREGGQLSFCDILGMILGVPVQIPFNGSNEVGARLQAVKNELKPGGLRPPLLIDPSCRMLIRGFASNYRFRRRPVNSSQPWDVMPDKTTPSADVHDALQYGIGGVRGLRGVIAEAGGGWGRGAAGWQSQTRPGRSDSPWARRGTARDFDVFRL
jgi:hypothetical protein